MRQVASITPIALLASLLASHGALAAGQAGDYSFTASIGESGTKKDNSYSSDQMVSFALLYQKSGKAAYRATAGLMSMNGREEISPSAGTRDASAFFLTGDLVFTPRFRVVHPFVAAGVGFYDVMLTDNQGNQNGLEVGINWGFGMDLQLLRWFELNGEIAYHYLTGDVSNPIQTITIGGRFDF
jgi:outer membrane protein with beta-barrel domain